ncbi:hypothetical protein L873DRAFT_598337 [Choiromyces venosus 120613-1]|uniref:Uncharacterized protein n=1 Tax=Choiromyces venosus 120613-1 TaxID=1336337 RepID=A0A3N4JTT8_9PEZI|nr:hypothetical protein L873DRAFT_598337 [Choiromyces venosus 120613-1]
MPYTRVFTPTVPCRRFPCFSRAGKSWNSGVIGEGRKERTLRVILTHKPRDMTLSTQLVFLPNACLITWTAPTVYAMIQYTILYIFYNNSRISIYPFAPKKKKINKGKRKEDREEKNCFRENRKFTIPKKRKNPIKENKKKRRSKRLG